MADSFRASRHLQLPDANLPEVDAFHNEDASSSTVDSHGLGPPAFGSGAGGIGSGGSTDLFKLYMRHKIIDANLDLNHCGYRLSVLEQLARHKMHYVRQLETVMEKLEDTPRYVAQVHSVLGRSLIRIKLGSESFVVPLCRKTLPNADQLRAGCKVGVRFSTMGKMEIYRIFPQVQDPLVTLMLVQKDTEATYEMIGGLESQILQIKEVVELPILHPELFTALGISQPKGVLLYGPPGTGKTLLAKAVAHHTKCAFFKLSGTELVQKYIGEGARLMRELFIMAREKAPSIIFLDEVDSIGGKRSDGGGSQGSDSSSCERTMIELLNQVDGFEPVQNIKVILATNRIDTLDEALIRPGRVDRKIFFPPPNLQGRTDILRIHSRRMNLGRTVCLRSVAERMPGASGAELKLICQEAAFSALREGRQFVTQEDFLQRIDKVMKSLANKADDGHVK